MRKTDSRDMIQNSIDYIEDHLKADIDAAELASRAGFSVFHFYRLFQAAVGYPIMQYILRRRLLHTVYAMRCGSKGIDAALEYGFETYAGFYKAFLREFGCTPQEFLKSRRAKRPIKPNLSLEAVMTVTHKKAAGILRHWNLENEPITDIYYDGTGEKNAHALYIGEQYVLKFTEDREKLESNIRLACALDAAGLCAALPIPTEEGKPYYTDGEIHFCLTRRLPGRQAVTSDFYAEEGGSAARFIGGIIGQLHKTLIKLELPVFEADLLEAFRHALPKAQSILRTDGTFCAELSSRFESLYKKLPRQIIHRDPNPGNIISDGNTWGFIDFELSERNVRIFDPCYAATAILSESFSDTDSEQNETWLTVYRNIFAGYEDAVGLTEEEREAAPYVLLANQMICVAWFSEQEKYREQFEANRKMTLWLIEKFEELKLR
ncbi:MAG: helix-turn-helix domain-containing protein [Clostridia bacterium]|nr:helix-turn-helix domain-containing protein [Clostridia bacterium]